MQRNLSSTMKNQPAESQPAEMTSPLCGLVAELGKQQEEMLEMTIRLVGPPPSEEGKDEEQAAGHIPALRQQLERRLAKNDLLIARLKAVMVQFDRSS